MIKRILVTLGVGVLVLAVVAGITVYAMFGGLQALPDRQEINGVTLVSDGVSGVAILPAESRNVVLIDAGMDETGAAIKAELERQGRTPEAVTTIFVTHGHADHLGAIKAFPNATVMALAEEVAFIAGTVRANSPLGRVIPVQATGIRVGRPLKDGDVIPIGDEQLKVYAVPGHTQGSAAYLFRGLLFLGDMGDVTSDGEMTDGHWLFSDDMDQSHESLRRLAARLTADGERVDALVFPHSGVLEKGLQPLMDLTAE